MARRGGGRAGRGSNVDDGFDREDTARTVHLMEDRMARMEDQFEAFTEQMTQRFDALMAAVPNQRRNRSPNLRRAREDGVDDVEEGFDNPFGGYDQRQSEFNLVVFPMLHYKPMMHMDGRLRRDRNRNEVVAELEELNRNRNRNTSSLQPQVDWSLPPIFDEYAEDGSLIVGKNESLKSIVFYDNIASELVEFLITNKAFGVSSEECLEIVFVLLMEVLEDQVEEVQHYDFLGVEHILSMYCARKSFVSYLEELLIDVRVLYLPWHMSDSGIEGSKYSKYLIRWKGRQQYLCDEDHLNSRTNSLQHGENDAEWKRMENNEWYGK